MTYAVTLQVVVFTNGLCPAALMLMLLACGAWQLASSDPSSPSLNQVPSPEGRCHPTHPDKGCKDKLNRHMEVLAPPLAPSRCSASGSTFFPSSPVPESPALDRRA